MTSLSPCCHAPVDYVYATWYACRVCGRWSERAPVVTLFGTVMTEESLPMHFEVYGHRGHAMSAVDVELTPIQPAEPLA